MGRHSARLVHPAEITNSLLERMYEPPKPWSVADFELRRESLVDFVKTKVLPLLDDTECRRIVIRAPVKSGKREMVEYIAMRDKQNGTARRVHAFLSAWHRVADDSQREELKHHNMCIFSIINTANTTTCIRWIMNQIAQGKHVVLHLDECDHGSGQTQMLSRVWRATRDNVNITNILYSATPEEVLFSGEIDDDEYNDSVAEIMEGHIVYYKPPRGYCGPRKFLRKGLVFNAKPFFTKVGATYRLTDQGKEIVSDLRTAIATNPERNIVVLRLSYSLGSGGSGRKENKAIYQFLRNREAFPELTDFLVVADKGEKFDGVNRVLKEDIKWSEDEYWEFKATGRPILIVIDQTSSRSTEWRCHNRIFAAHDYRDSVTFSVVSQAQERVNHYKQKYGGAFQPIRVYGHRKTWELSAKKITYSEYINNEWTKRKVDRRTTGDAELYRILNSATGAVHPEHRAPITESAADEILLNLGCGAIVNVSARVRGGVKTVPEIVCSFHPCTKDTYSGVAALAAFPTNPFIASDREMAAHPDRWPLAEGQIGNLREWGVYEYDYIVRNKGNRMSVQSVARDPRGRITICYKDGVLGVALRKPTGRTRTEDSMTAFQSMYVARA
jgi:hypothetical protein